MENRGEMETSLNGDRKEMKCRGDGERRNTDMERRRNKKMEKKNGEIAIVTSIIFNLNFHAVSNVTSILSSIYLLIILFFRYCSLRYE